MKSCVVAIAKYEGKYINEWVEYNLSIGFDHIIIGDNNDDNTENLAKILMKYIKEGKVTVVDIKDYYIKQIDFYKYAYQNLVGRFDWVLFYDIDEFLVLNKHSNVNDYLKQKKFKNFDVIKICWKVMSNNGYVVEIDKPVLERFTEEGINYKCDFELKDKDGNNYDCYVNNTVKSFYRTSAKCIPQTHCTEKHVDGIRYCDNTGNEIIDKEYFPNWSQRNEYINHDDAYIKHFLTKSLEEYVKYKIKRGWSCFKTEEADKYVKETQLTLDQFEMINGKKDLYKILFDEYMLKYKI